MNSSVALRMFWKEYRVQRGLWVALAIGTVLLHCMLRVMIDRNATMGPVSWFLAATLTFCYAVGAGSIAFATEREDGTHLRLLTMCPSPTLTFFIKLLYAAVATAALATVTGLSAALFSGTPIPAADTPWYHFSPLARFVTWAIAGVAWGMLFSLLFRHVFAALLGAALTTLITMGIVTSFWGSIDTWYGRYGDEYRQFGVPGNSFFGILACNLAVLAGIGILSGVNLALTHRWLKRAFFDDRPSRIRFWMGQTRVRRQSTAGSVTVEIGMQTDLTTPVLSPEEAAIQPAPRLSLSWLYHVWGRRGLRPFRFLRWKEATETRVPWLIGCAVVALIVGLASEVHHHLPDGPHFIALIGIPAVLGLMTFRGEQRHENYRLLSDRGLSPRTVWLSKHCVWVPRTVLTVLLVFVVSATVAGRPGTWRDLAEGVFCFGPLERFHSRYYSHFASAMLGEVPFVRCLVISLVLYAIGQAASLSFRRGIVAVFATLLGVILTMLWTTFCTSGGIPLLLCVFPAAPALLLFTYWRTRGWMIDRNSVKAWLLPATVLTCAVAGCFGLSSVYRVAEIPAVVRSESVDGLAAESLTALRGPLTASEEQTADLYRAIERQITRDDPTTWTHHDGENGRWLVVTADTREWINANRKALLETREAAARDVCAFGTAHDVRLSPPAGDQAFWLVFREALIETANGDVDEALSLFRDALAVCRHRAGRGGEFASWMASRHETDGVLIALAHWSVRPEVDAQLIERATSIIRNHIRSLPDAATLNWGAHQRLRTIIAAGPDTILNVADRNRSTYDSPLSLWLHRFPGETRRMLRMVDWAEREQAGFLASFKETAENDPGNAFRALRNQDTGLDAQFGVWERTTPSLRGLHAKHAFSAAAQDVILQTRARATILSMHLLLTERSEGQLPETLAGTPADLSDPWSGSPFMWYPEGVPQELKANGNVPANTPFILSIGPEGARIERVEYELVSSGMMGMMQGGMGSAGGASPEAFGADGAGLGQPPEPESPRPEDVSAEDDEAQPKTVVEYVFRQQHEGSFRRQLFTIPRPSDPTP